jgi:hypothetical protein
MRNIIPNILFLFQYLIALSNFENFRPSNCPICGCGGLWVHGHYERKCDRTSTGEANLNPIPILRFFCHHCQHTCSVLPECIPPRRWYLWIIQQRVIEKMLIGEPVNCISQSALPSRWTIKRWMNELTSRFVEFAACLKSGFSWLGYCSDFNDFWRACFARMTLSQSMVFLNNHGVIVP